MTDANESPLDLRALADVESPEVVRQALRRFRRRSFIRMVWVVPVIALLIGLRVAGPLKPTLTDRIQGAPGVQVGAVYQLGGATVILEREADLGDTAGLTFVAADPEAANVESVTVESATPLDEIRFDSDGRATTLSMELKVPPSGRMTFKVIRSTCPPQGGECGQQNLGTFVVDLRALGVPNNLWT